MYLLTAIDYYIICYEQKQKYYLIQNVRSILKLEIERY
jgi:hypothetical protein